MNAKIELKPCPFCGADAYISSRKGCSPWRFVSCLNCGASSAQDTTDEDVTRRWNNRAQQPPPPAPLPSLREVEEHLRDMAGKQWNLPHHARLDNAAADVLALVRESDQERSSDDSPDYVYVWRSKLSRLVRLEEAT